MKIGAPTVLAFILVGLFLAMLPTPGLAGDVCMTAPTVPIPAEWAAVVMDVLNTAPVLPADVRCFAIINKSAYSDHQALISIAGIIGDPANWNLQDHAIWFSLVALEQAPAGGAWSGAIRGTPRFVELIEQFPITAEAIAALGGDTDTQEFFAPAAPTADNYFPFASGTSVIYGINGVHSHGNLVAVDFVSWEGDGMAPNAVYAAASGYVSNICRDDTQMGLRIGNFYYLHLVNDGAITEGRYYMTHDFVGNMVTGNFNDECGNASQQPGHWHLHFAFAPSSGQLRMEAWTLNTSTGVWTHDSGATRSTGSLIGPADWGGYFPPPPPTPPVPPTAYPPGTTPQVPPISGTPGPPGPNGYGFSNGTNFWSFLTGGIRDLGKAFADQLAGHEYMSMANTVREYAALPAAVLFYTAVINYRFPFLVVMAIFVMESVRWVYAAYMLIKRAIPFAG